MFKLNIEEEVDIKAVQGRINEIEKELEKVQGKMASYLEELGLR